MKRRTKRRIKKIGLALLLIILLLVIAFLAMEMAGRK